jgi:hypothetical protein
MNLVFGCICFACGTLFGFLALGLMSGSKEQDEQAQKLWAQKIQNEHNSHTH